MKKQLIVTFGAIVTLIAATTQVPAMATNNNSEHKDNDTWVFVCKYVGTPNINERLKEGKQPIRVKSSATVGTWFNDAQGRSYVLDISTEANTDKQGNEYTGDKTCPNTTSPTAQLDYDVYCDEDDNIAVVVDNSGTAAGSITLQGQTVIVPAGQTISRTYKSGTEITLAINGKTVENGIITCETAQPEEPGKGGETPTTPTTPTTSVTPAGENTAVSAPAITHLPTTSGNGTTATIAILAGLSALVAAFSYGIRLVARRFI